MVIKTNNQFIFNILLIYYWLSSYVFGVLPEFERFSFNYFLVIVPICVFNVLYIKKLIGKQSSATLTLWLLLTMVFFISLFRFDVSTIMTFSLIITTIIIILNGQFYIELKLLNTLFILSIFISIILFHLGLTIYGYIPGQTFYNGVDIAGERWRISLFPYLLDSGLFSLVIIFINYFYNRNQTLRYLYCSIGIYFLIFTGLRTAIIIFFLFIVFIIIKKFIEFKPSLFYKIFNWSLILLVVLSLSSVSIIRYFALRSDNKFVNKILFKKSDEKITSSDIAKTQTRAWIWEEHLKIFSRNIIFGIGSFDFSKEVPKAPKNMKASESPLTGYLARIGISAILFILFFSLLWNQALEKRKSYPYFISFVIIISLLTYGSYFNPYNFLFLVLFSSYNKVV